MVTQIKGAAVFNNLSNYLLIDVRSPSEYQHAHIPGALSLPLFSDEERAIVGTTYKQQSRTAAIKIGLPFFGTKLVDLVTQVEKWSTDLHANKLTEKKTILVHCWRGGMRSAAIAWLLDLYGFNVVQLIGGYKAYRNWILEQFDKPYTMQVLGGYTGSGKTETLIALAKNKVPIIDLEKIANHKGSSFGALGQAKQESQEMFENRLGSALSLQKENSFWIEDESQRIGANRIPTPFFKQMRNSICYFIDIPFKERLDFIAQHYGQFSATELIAATLRIQKRLGGLETKMAIQMIEEKKTIEAFAILLKYYDKWYTKSGKNETIPKKEISYLQASTVDATKNAQLLMAIDT